MSWLTTLGNLLVPAPPEREHTIVTKVSETVDLGEMIDADDYMYRRMTNSHRDLNPVTQDRAREVSHYLWRQNPFARRLVEMMLDQVVGDGVTFEAVEDDVQEVIDDFWTDPEMNLEENFRGLLRDLSLDGELVLRAFVGDGGVTQVGYIDADRIKEVHKNTENALLDAEVVLKPPTLDAPDVVLQVIRTKRSRISGREKRTYEGDTFFRAVNRRTAGTRGTPDLLALADWIDGHDQILFNALDRTALQNAFVWDVTLQGADATRISEWLAEHGEAPRPGAVRVHNDAEKWETVSPTLGAVEIEVVARLIKNLVLGGAGLPEAWFADGDSANRATVAEQGSPTYKMIRARQQMVRHLLTNLLNFVIDQAVAAGRITSEDHSFKVNLPEPSSDDTTSLVTALPNLTKSMLEAVAERLISRKSARELFLLVASQLGIDLDPSTEEEQIEEEEAEELDALMQNPVVDPMTGMAAEQALAAGKRPKTPRPAQAAVGAANVMRAEAEEKAKAKG